MSKREFHKPVVLLFRQNGIVMLRNGRHGIVFMHPQTGQRVNLRFKLNDKNLAKKTARKLGLELKL